MTPFERAFELVVESEGGFVDDPSDPGGKTKFGVSQRAYPDEDIERMTLARAQFLYRRDYWDRISGDSLPEGVALVLFDFAVNSGVSQAVKSLQRLLGVTSDGQIGPMTIAATRAIPSRRLVSWLSAERALYVAGLPTFSRFGRGWTRRIISMAMETA